MQSKYINIYITPFEMTTVPTKDEVCWLTPFQMTTVPTADTVIVRMKCVGSAHY